MPCIGGIAPCTGWVTGEACRDDFVLDTGSTYSIIQSIEYTSTQIIVHWTGEPLNWVLKMVLIEEGVGINDVVISPVTDLSAGLGHGLVDGVIYKLFYRNENTLFKFFRVDRSTADPYQLKEWKMIPITFLGIAYDIIVDGLDYMVDGPLPYYLVDL